MLRKEMVKLSQKMKPRKGRRAGKKPKKKVSKRKKKKSKSKKKSKKSRKGKQLKNSKRKKNKRGGKSKVKKGKKGRKGQKKKRGWEDFIRPQKLPLINKKQTTKNQKQLKLYIFIALLCSVFILPDFDTVQHMCHTTNNQHVSIFINVLCFPFNHVCCSLPMPRE